MTHCLYSITQISICFKHSLHSKLSYQYLTEEINKTIYTIYTIYTINYSLRMTTMHFDTRYNKCTIVFTNANLFMPVNWDGCANRTLCQHMEQEASRM